jgi:Leucine-rich repeat (LRR) protein
MQQPYPPPSSSAYRSRVPLLPHDLIKSTLNYLTDGELLRARLVNKKWLQAVADCVECFLGEKEADGRVVGRWADTLDDGRFTPSFRKQVRMVLCVLNDTTPTFRRQGIRGIDLSQHCDLEGDQTVAKLAKVCPSLTSLSVASCRVSDLSLSSLAAMPQLEELSLSATIVTTVGQLPTSTELKRLFLTGCTKLTDPGVAGLESLPYLEELDLSGTKVASVAHLSASRSLKKLRLESCLNMTDAGIAGLQAIPTLEELDLSSTDITSVAHLTRCLSLQKLILACCHYLTDVGILGLEAIPTLQELDLRDTNITSVAHLSASRALRKLTLALCYNVTDASILGLEAIPTLEDVDLAQTKVTTAAHWCRCLTLKRLRFQLATLTETSFTGIGALPTLEELDLSCTKVRGVTHLSASRSWKKPVLAACSELTDADTAGLW